MNKILLLLSFTVSICAFSQSISHNETSILVNDSIKIEKDTKLLVHKPYEYDFVYIQPVQKGLNLNKVANVAKLGGTVGSLLGSVSSNVKTLQTATKVIITANQVENVLMTTEQINSLNASNKAKKLVGKQFTVSRWELENSDYILYGKIEDKEYKISLLPAMSLNEIIIIKNKTTF